jgi:hypothetical protein
MTGNAVNGTSELLYGPTKRVREKSRSRSRGREKKARTDEHGDNGKNPSQKPKSQSGSQRREKLPTLTALLASSRKSKTKSTRLKKSPRKVKGNSGYAIAAGGDECSAPDKGLGSKADKEERLKTPPPPQQPQGPESKVDETPPPPQLPFFSPPDLSSTTRSEIGIIAGFAQTGCIHVHAEPGRVRATVYVESTAVSETELGRKGGRAREYDPGVALWWRGDSAADESGQWDVGRDRV